MTTATAPDLRITITAEATVFEGLVNVRRHDHPLPSEIASYVLSLVGPRTQNLHLCINASDEHFDALCDALAGSDIVITRDDQLEETSEGRHALKEVEAIDIKRPVDDSLDRPGVQRFLIILAAVVVAAGLCAGAIWATVTTQGGFVPPATQQPITTDTTTTSVDTPTREQPTPMAAVISRGGLIVEVPRGFNVHPDGDMWRATSPDPDFRLQLAIDPLEGTEPDALRAQLLAEIEDDPDVELVDVKDSGLTYREHNPDGSQALWRTWVDSGYQLSIGCHTRHTPTPDHLEICTTAMDSALFDADQAA